MSSRKSSKTRIRSALFDFSSTRLLLLCFHRFFPSLHLWLLVRGMSKAISFSFYVAIPRDITRICITASFHGADLVKGPPSF